MLAMIERRVGIRQIWRCRAGWGLCLLLPRDHPDAKILLDPTRDFDDVVYTYYPTLEARRVAAHYGATEVTFEYAGKIGRASCRERV